MGCCVSLKPIDLVEERLGIRSVVYFVIDKHIPFEDDGGEKTM